MRMLGFQEIDIISMVRPITKYAVTVRDPQSIRYHLEKAACIARSGRPGPVWIDIPLDIQAANIDPNNLKKFDRSELSPSDTAQGSELKNLVKETLLILSKSKRPVILAGYGIKLAKCRGIFMDLIEKLDIPVLTTWKGADLLPEDHRLFYEPAGFCRTKGR